MRLGGWIVMLSAMVIFLTLIGFQTGLTDVLTYVGVDINVTDSTFTSDVSNSEIWSLIILAIIGVTAGSIIIGLFGKGYDPSLVYAPLIVAFAGVFGTTFWSIISYVSSFNQWWMTSIIGLIFGTLSIGFLMACLDYFGGRG